MSYQMTFADLSQDLNQPQEAKEIYRSKEICILHCPVCGDVVGVKLIHLENVIEYSEECRNGHKIKLSETTLQIAEERGTEIEVLR